MLEHGSVGYDIDWGCGSACSRRQLTSTALALLSRDFATAFPSRCFEHLGEAKLVRGSVEFAQQALVDPIADR
jgi:hypothetical protein